MQKTNLVAFTQITQKTKRPNRKPIKTLLIGFRYFIRWVFLLLYMVACCIPNLKKKRMKSLYLRALAIIHLNGIYTSFIK